MSLSFSPDSRNFCRGFLFAQKLRQLRNIRRNPPLIVEWFFRSASNRSRKILNTSLMGLVVAAVVVVGVAVVAWA